MSLSVWIWEFLQGCEKWSIFYFGRLSFYRNCDRVLRKKIILVRKQYRDTFLKIPRFLKSTPGDPRWSPGVLFQISKVQTKRMNMVSKSFKWCMYYIFSSNFIIESLKHKLNCCFGIYINSYWIAHCECDEHLTILNHFKRVFLTHIVAPDWGKLHTFKNSAFILPLSHIKISVYAELGARVYEVFYEILSICQKSTPGVPRGTFSKSGYSIKNMAYKAAPSSTVESIFVNAIFVNKLNLDLLYFL